ncbi:MAG: zinc-ribbon domain containing protein [Planctomycetes bacterium]|nr:zinc-ribbon domain containing protein [Planctomycetota bacterium]
MFDQLSEASQRSWGIPEYYKDENYACIDCGEESTFTAQLQKYWYEVKKGYFYQRPIRCRACHEVWRAAKTCKHRMDRLLAKLDESPEDGKLMIETAAAIVEFHIKEKRGNLALAMHLLRQVKSRKEVKTLMAYCQTNLTK